MRCFAVKRELGLQIIWDSCKCKEMSQPIYVSELSRITWSETSPKSESFQTFGLRRSFENRSKQFFKRNWILRILQTEIAKTVWRHLKYKSQDFKRTFLMKHFTFRFSHVGMFLCPKKIGLSLFVDKNFIISFILRFVQLFQSYLGVRSTVKYKNNKSW